MTENEMHDALTAAGYKRISTTTNFCLNVPFQSHAKCNLAVYYKAGTSPYQKVYLYLPMAGMDYSTRALNKMHRESMRNLKQWDLDVGAEVLRVLGKCS